MSSGNQPSQVPPQVMIVAIVATAVAIVALVAIVYGVPLTFRGDPAAAELTVGAQAHQVDK